MSAQSQKKTEISIKKHSIEDYPEGAYYTFDDFKEKKVRPVISLKSRCLNSDNDILNDSIVNQVNFFGVQDENEFHDVFAVVFNGNLYFQQKYLIKYALKGNRNETGSNGNSYHRVIKEGNFFYLEGSFGNVLTKGFLNNMGAAGGTLAQYVNHLKGVIYDFDKKGFDFIKNCDDFNNFLKDHHSTEIVDCKSKNYNIYVLREIIEKVITENK